MMTVARFGVLVLSLLNVMIPGKYNCIVTIKVNTYNYIRTVLSCWRVHYNNLQKELWIMMALFISGSANH